MSSREEAFVRTALIFTLEANGFVYSVYKSIISYLFVFVNTLYKIFLYIFCSMRKKDSKKFQFACICLYLLTRINKP